MGIFNNLFNFFKRPKKGKLILNSSQNLYDDLISEDKVKSILANIPENLTDLEKAYYIYIELGKILGESSRFLFSDIDQKIEHYDDKIDSNFKGICKSISELFVNVLKDKRVGIDADLVRQNPESKISHVDTILKIDGKNYICNLISDLSNIQSSKRINSFCFDLDYGIIPEEYKEKLRNYYGNIEFLDRNTIEKMDKKFGYSYVGKNSDNSEKGIYTNDVINMLREELSDPENFKKHILKNEEVVKEDIPKYKMDFLFKNVEKYTHYNKQMDYLETVQYLMYIAKKMFSPGEISNMELDSYVAIQNDDYSNLISILKLKTSEIKTFYYLFSKESRTFVEKTPVEMKEYLDKLDKKSLKIVGSFANPTIESNNKDLFKEIDL